MWWFDANVTTYLLGAAAYEFGKRVLDVSSISKGITAAFPVLGFLIYGVTAERSHSKSGRAAKSRVVVELDLDSVFEDYRWRHPCRFMRIRRDLKAADLPARAAEC